MTEISDIRISKEQKSIQKEMKGKIASLAIMAMTLFSSAAIAQKPAKCVAQSSTPCQVQICDESAVCPAACRPMRDGQCNMMAYDFSSLELTADQKSKIETLNETQRKQIEQCRCDRKDAKDAAKAQARQKRQDVKKNYLNGLRSILTPDQYTKFLEDNFVNGNPDKGRKAKAHKMKVDRNNRIKSAEFQKGGKVKSYERAKADKAKSK